MRKTMNYGYLMIFGSALLLCGSISAQDIKNTTVSVTRAYEGQLVDVHKPDQKMTVPDSLTSFALDFDYSVFENPYRGAYDFKPYFLDMKPAPDAYTGRKLYLKAGAGWRLRPTLDFVWEPEMKKRLRMSVYASHNSYFGDFRTISPDAGGYLKKDVGSQNGYDSKTVAGVSGRADFVRSRLTFDVNYTGIHVKDSLAATGFNAAAADFRLKSTMPSRGGIIYDLAMKYRFASQGPGDMQTPSWTGMSGTAAKSLNANDVDLSAMVGREFRPGSQFQVAMDLGLSSYSSLFTSSAATAMLTPKYMMNRDKWKLSLGVGFGLKINSDEDVFGYRLNSNRGQIIYPDLYASYEAVPDHMNLYLSVTSGFDRNPYFSQKERNHFYNPYFSGGLAPFSFNTVERINAAFGFEGNIRTRFRYDWKFGYSSYDYAPMDLLVTGTDYASGTPVYSAAVVYRSFNQFYTELKAQWESKSFSLDAKLRACVSDIDRREILCFAPSALTGNINAAYNWKRRLFFRCTAEMASRRSGWIYNSSEITASKAYIPFWMNLGIEAEYAFTSKLSFWLRGDNLLNMNIQRTPLYNAGGIGATGGIRLVL